MRENPAGLQPHVAHIPEIATQPSLAMRHVPTILRRDPSQRCQTSRRLFPSPARPRIRRIHQCQIHAADRDPHHAVARGLARSQSPATAPKHVGNARGLRIQQTQRTRFMRHYRNPTLLIVLSHFQVREPFRSHRPGDTVHIQRDDVTLHPFSMQTRIASTLQEIDPPQPTFACSDQRTRTASRIHQIQRRHFINRPIDKPPRRQCRQQFRHCRFRIVRRSLLTIRNQTLPQLARKVVDVLRLQTVQIFAELFQIPQNFRHRGRIADRQKTRLRQLHHRKVVNTLDHIPSIEQMLLPKRTHPTIDADIVCRLQTHRPQRRTVRRKIIVQIDRRQPNHTNDPRRILRCFSPDDIYQLRNPLVTHRSHRTQTIHQRQPQRLDMLGHASTVYVDLELRHLGVFTVGDQIRRMRHQRIVRPHPTRRHQLHRQHRLISFQPCQKLRPSIAFAFLTYPNRYHFSQFTRLAEKLFTQTILSIANRRPPILGLQHNRPATRFANDNIRPSVIVDQRLPTFRVGRPSFAALVEILRERAVGFDLRQDADSALCHHRLHIRDFAIGVNKMVPDITCNPHHQRPRTRRDTANQRFHQPTHESQFRSTF